MASAITNTIGQAVAASLPSVNQLSQSRQVLPATSTGMQQQIAQSSQVAAARTATQVVNHRERVPQKPKRTEGTYTKQGLKKKPARRAPLDEFEAGDEQIDLKV